MPTPTKTPPRKAYPWTKNWCPLRENPPSDSSEIVVADENGDVVLHLQDSAKGMDTRIRCSSQKLRKASSYFEVLLDPTKFSTGINLGQKIQQLAITFGEEVLLPVDKLPVVLIQDAGEMPPNNDHSRLAIATFFEALHQDSKKNLESWERDGLHESLILALVAILADHFAAIGPVMQYVRKSRDLETRLFQRPETFKEPFSRRMILAGILLENRMWTKVHSADLICWGSKKWRLQRDDLTSTEGILIEEKEEQPLWWSLPRGIEGTACGSYRDSCK